MQQTLLVIPDWLFTGWLTTAFVVAALLTLAVRAFKEGWKPAVMEYGPLLLIAGSVIHFVLPRLVIDGVNPEDPVGPLIPIGLAIRGYGVFLMLAIVSAIGLLVVRCRRISLDVEPVLTLCFYMVLFGIAGARIFYVVQKWSSDNFRNASLSDIINMTQGGMVVYGSLIGGIFAAMVYFYWSKLPVLKTLDALAPSMVLGLAIGRIGCLLNGCCYGGDCGDFPLGLQFPAGSPPYMDQLDKGLLLGIDSEKSGAEDEARTVRKVREGSVAQGYSIQPGEHFLVRGLDALRMAAVMKDDALRQRLAIAIQTEKSGEIKLPLSEIPTRSLPVHPTQIYASVNAGLLTLLLWFWSDRKKFEGQIFAAMMIIYPASRFLLEMIRQDEAGVLGTVLTISQWISILIMPVGMVGYLWLYGRFLHSGNR